MRVDVRNYGNQFADLTRPSPRGGEEDGRRLAARAREAGIKPSVSRKDIGLTLGKFQIRYTSEDVAFEAAAPERSAPVPDGDRYTPSELSDRPVEALHAVRRAPTNVPSAEPELGEVSQARLRRGAAAYESMQRLARAVDQPPQRSMFFGTV